MNNSNCVLIKSSKLWSLDVFVSTLVTSFCCFRDCKSISEAGFIVVSSPLLVLSIFVGDEVGASGVGIWESVCWVIEDKISGVVGGSGAGDIASGAGAGARGSGAGFIASGAGFIASGAGVIASGAGAIASGAGVIASGAGSGRDIASGAGAGLFKSSPPALW